MRTLSLGLSTLLLASFAAAAPAAGAPSAAAPDWRAEACAEAGQPDVSITGTGAIVNSSATRVAELPGMTLTNERLDFSGVKCELLYVSGDVPAGASGSYGYMYTTYADLVVDATPRGETEYKQSSGGSTSFYFSSDSSLIGTPSPREVIAAIAYPATESGVFPASPFLPPDWQGKPYTSAYTRSAWDVTVRGKALAEKSFKRTEATDRAARAASVRNIAKAKASYAETVAQIKSGSSSAPERKAELAQAKRTQSASIALAKKTLRLALKGTKLVPGKFKKTYSGALTNGG